MKRLLTILLILLLCCRGAVAQTVGSEISADEITEFCYTYDWVGYNAFYQRYRFYTENGKHLFFHETRGTENDYGWNSEDDVTAIGTKALSAEEWAAFVDLLTGGTVTGRSEEVLDGDSGPWMYLYWSGDESICQEFHFPSASRQAAFVDFCDGLATEPLTEAGLISCEYGIFGGIENDDTSYALTQGGAGKEAVLTVEEGGKRKTYGLPGSALDDLADFVAGYHPEKWEKLPDADYFALDAPSRQITLTYEDGKTYTVRSSQVIGGPLFRELEHFLRSYLAKNARSFELSFSSFGGGPEFKAILTAPEKIRVETSVQYDVSSGQIPPGSEYGVTMVFHGRIPGQTELTIGVYGPLAPTEGALPTVYVLEVDEDYNVTPVAQREQAARNNPAAAETSGFR